MRPGGSRQATLFQAWGAGPGRPGGDEGGAASGTSATAPSRAPGPSAAGFVGGPAGQLWLFPAGGGLEERGYQVRAAAAALEANTLLCLPTGLGKTLVAAAVLYNFYRWFPAGRAVFLAPTKPLVAQQREACARLMGIPGAHMAQLTGGTQVVDRKEIWQNRRVFFLTPQIMINDLSRGICPAAEVKCLVIDEAHKALGNHAYCQVVKELCKYTQQFRVLALTATPGNDTKAVQQVISNLLISHIELYSEDSPDIRPYSYERLVEKCVVPLGKELSEMRSAYIRVLEALAGRLIRFRVLAQREVSALTKYQIILARDQFRKNPASCFSGVQQGIIEGDFALCISLYHGYELLLQMGMRSLYIFLRGIMDGSKGMTRAKNELSRNEEFMALYNLLESTFVETSVTLANGNTRSGTEKMKPFIYSHPKLKKLEDVVVEHFRSWKDHGDQSPAESRPADTRVMIFSSFRDSVHEIAEMLSRHHPVVRVMTFVGHSTGKNAKGFTQKEQLEVVKHFRTGGYNTLVSTCVGEEGLDIGEVDLIICFDAQKSPIRLIQRMGRTGRKRQGRIVVILSEGREERTYNQSQSNKRSLLKAISENKVLRLYQHSPRMIPEGVNPKMHKMLITPPDCESGTSPPSPTKGRPDALQRKWLPCYTAAGAKQANSSDCWHLTAEEFEVWNRSYKLKTEDGIKKPVMPQSRFETLEDGEKKIDSQAEDVNELSLTEWGLWQNRPFPTHLVDHSDRCRHFISVMKMIEQMRHEEEDCCYESNIQPYIQWEDVDASVMKRRKCVLDSVVAQKASSSRKSLGVALKAERCSSLLQDLDAECLSLFKATSFKSAKKPQALNAESEGHSNESSVFSGCVQLFEDAGRKALLHENKERSSASAGHENAVARELQSAVEDCSTWDGRSVESDSGCFSEENLLSSSLFYLPVLEADGPPITGLEEDPSCGRDILINIARLLSQSPPSLNQLLDFERTNEVQETDSVQKCVSSVYADNYFEGKKTTHSEVQKPSLTSHNTCQLTGSPKACSLNNHLLETSCDLEASVNQNNGMNWDELFDIDDEEQIGTERRSLSVANRDLAESPLQRGVEEGREKCKDPGRNMSPGEEGSVFLFGREGSSERSRLSGGKSRKHPGCSTVAEDLGVSPWQPSNEHLPVTLGDPVGSLIIQLDEAIEATDRAGEANLHPEELYDVSQDLFSVNFDLGFSVEESEDEASEQVDNVRKHGSHQVAEDSLSNGKLARQFPLTCSNACFERTKFSTPVHLPNQNSGLTVTKDVVPLTSPLMPAGEKLCRSPDFVSCEFSTPKSRRTMNSRVPRGANLSCLFRNVQGSPEEAVPSKARTSTDEKALANSADGVEGFAPKETGNGECKNQNSCNLISAEVGASSGSEDEVVFLRKNKRKRNVLVSPNVNNSSEFESPIHAVGKRRRPCSALDWSSEDSMDLPKKANRICVTKSKTLVRGVKRQKCLDSIAIKNAAKQFIDEEAELSDDGAVEVSSDETGDSERELSSSLNQFLNDDTQIMQDLNESEMQAVYLKSVRSPAVGNRQGRMVRKPCDLAAIFSQVPEQDESYLVDSFCVREDEEEGQPKSSSSEGEEICLDFDLLEEESFADGRKQYCTRRRKKLEKTHAEKPSGRPLLREKPSRVRILDSSSEDEERVDSEQLVESLPNGDTAAGSHLVPSLASDRSRHRRISSPENQRHPPQESRAQILLGLKASLAEELDFQPQCRDPGKSELRGRDFQSTLKPGDSSRCSSASTRLPLGSLEKPAPLCILADSREISSGLNVISALRAVHGIKVQVCSLGSCDYIVSNRLAVERRCQTELLKSTHRSKVVQRVQQLKSKFDRICVIIEKERARAGEAQKGFHRTKHYDGLLSALLRAGIRVLFSSCQEETAKLLKELALVERRKNAAILVPAEVQGPSQDALHFYLSMPCVSYVMALALCHCFRSVKEAANSSPGELAARTQVSQQKAEEVYHYIHYGFDKQMLPERIT
ncbi:Fanconi anemia group M protein [Eublepharis macularius]|uniref:ATP-dependent RNA helicase FANCM n=1 Tax=Eublepharis macularius TaxID=481883 RepID=A0AA97KPA8_EUBMA|nr:Fanconi anemia group M protein [Eublepharis macularius]